MLKVKGLLIGFAFVVAFAAEALGQSLPKVRAAYTSIGIQFDPVYIMKELELPRKYGVDAEILFVPVSSRAVQAALAGEIQFITSAGVANINANVSGGDFVGLTATLNTFVFKILAQSGNQKARDVKGKEGRHFPAGRRQRFFHPLCADALGPGSRQRRGDYSGGRRAGRVSGAAKQSGGCRRFVRALRDASACGRAPPCSPI